MNKHTLPTVVIVGRPNVGKSSLLNRIVGSPHAIVDPTPGVTRDRNYAQTSWNGRYFQIIDTGGLDPDQTTPVQEAINNQVDFALHEAEAIIFVCDFRDGLVHDDKTIFNLLRKKCGSKQVFICINKIDNTNLPDPINEFYPLGAKRFFPVSSLHGHGIADLLDEIVKPWPRMEEPDEKTLRSERIAIIGKPNVGKSALMNKLLGAERTIVDDTPGTTRDAITVSIEHKGKTYRFIDTAGLRRPARKKASVELNSVYRTLNAIDRSDISILVLDASEMAISEQDKRIASRILEAGSACIIVWNKWDIVSDRSASWDELLKKTRFELNLMEFAPVISCSAKTGLRTDRLFEMIDQVRESKNADIPESRLSEILHESMIIQPPPTYKGRPLRIKGLRRLKQSGVTFIVNCSEPGGLHFSYRRYLLNQIRHENSFEGWPVRLLVRKIESESN